MSGVELRPQDFSACEKCQAVDNCTRFRLIGGGLDHRIYLIGCDDFIWNGTPIPEVVRWTVQNVPLYSGSVLSNLEAPGFDREISSREYQAEQKVGVENIPIFSNLST